MDWIGMLLTVWWGAGYVFVIFLVLRSKMTSTKINWKPTRVAISWLCKFYYLIYVAVAFYWGMPKLVFVMSAWIASDQIEKCFASLDADRTRRTFHDFWLFRIMYPLFLLSPFALGLQIHFQIYGVLLLILWSLGILFVWKRGHFMSLPDDPSLLRNMTYYVTGVQE
ncbi:MAG: hypothetical protein NT027_18995 [Proteobacteria bacterium]|nr:hypothetical protein [Pseudomonadota bacterium]